MMTSKPLLNKIGKGYLWRLWFIAIAAWALQLFVSYALVEWHCARPQAFSEHTFKWSVGVLTLLCLGATLGNLLQTLRYYRQLRQHSSGQSRALFMAAGGVLLSGFLAVVIIVQGLPNLILTACSSVGG